MKYLDLSLQEINKLLKDKTITPTTLVLECLNTIELNNLNAFITINKEEALKQALELENKEVDNLLFGIPIAIKDNIVTKNLRTTAASKMLENFIPIYDATVVRKIKQKNMIIIGKTNMDEFAMGSTGETSYFKPTLNPIDNTLVPGGSSSGSAAAVASKSLFLALGSDTGGSIRQPASFCGIVGLKPTYGRVSRYGLIAFASSLDQIGPMTRNVYENATLLNVISGHDELDQTSSENIEDFTRLIGQNISNLKIAVPNFYLGEAIDKEIKDKILKTIEYLKNQGCQVDIIDLNYLECAIPLYQIIALSEASSNLARFDGIKFGYQTSNFKELEDFYCNTRSEGFGEEVKRRLMIGSYVLSGQNAHIYYEKALCVRQALKDSFEEKFKTYDLIIGPTTTDVAYKLNTKTNSLKSFYDDLLTIPANMTGLPAISLPIGTNSQNLPIGLQIIANHFQEATIYQLASFLEQNKEAL